MRPPLLLLALFALCALLPFTAQAQGAERKVVRVGWYESPFNFADRFGRRSGYAYEYQQKIAAYTGWEFEYVDASFPDLMDMLARGGRST